MDTQPPPESKVSTNGTDKPQSMKSQPENTAFGGKGGSLEKSLRDRLVYLTTCKIGHPVEAYLKNGSVYSGIFHAADVEKDFGIILKMARLIKDGTLRGHKSRYEFVRKPPSKTFIIPADELVQVVAKDLSVSKDSILDVVQIEKTMELLTDASISKSSYGDRERELKPWVPDEDVPQRPDLENVFDNSKNRGWNQFEVNESLFGVKSTFNEELYTTRLNRGSHTKGLEEQAMRIAREIEGESTRDLHVAEERGHQLSEKFDRDDETKYSSVRTRDGFDDSGFDAEDDTLLDTCNSQTFGGASTSDGQKPASSSKGTEELSGDGQSSRDNTVDTSCVISDDHARDPPSDQWSKDFPPLGSSISENQLGERRNNNDPEVSHDNRSAEESVSGHGDINDGAKSGGGATSASKAAAERESEDSQVSASAVSESHPAPSTSSLPGLSPSSSIGSLSLSEKSAVNPNAKESKLNPNAKCFEPFQPVVALRPQYSIPEPSYYYPVPLGQQMPGMPGMPPGAYPQMLYPPPQTYYPPQHVLRMLQQQQMMQNQPPLPQPNLPPPPPPPPGGQNMP